MNISKTTLKVMAKTVVEEGIDIQLLIVYLEELLDRPINEGNLLERMKRAETLKFLNRLQEIEQEFPWAIITTETPANFKASLANVKKLIRLLD